MNGIRKELGFISRADFGYGGYQDAMFGLSLTFEGEGWGVGDFIGTWGLCISSEGAGWGEEERDKKYAESMRRYDDILRKSGKSNLASIVGTPVEVTLENGCLKEWRILEEVIKK